MGVISTYGTLKSEMADYLNRTDLTARIPGFVQRVEDDLSRIPHVEYESDPTSLVLNSALVTLPTDCKEIKSLYFDDGTRSGEIGVYSPQELANLKRDVYGVTAGVPRAVSVVSNGTKLQVTPTPDQSYTATMIYRVKLTRLTTGTDSGTNWVLTSHSDIYLFGGLLQAMPFLKNDARIPTWKEFYEKSLEDLRLFLWNRQFSANTPKPRIRVFD